MKLTMSNRTNETHGDEYEGVICVVVEPQITMVMIVRWYQYNVTQNSYINNSNDYNNNKELRKKINRTDNLDVCC